MNPRIALAALFLALPALPAGVAARPAATQQQASAHAFASRDGGNVTLRWAGIEGPVSVWLLPSADARAGGKPLARQVTGESVTLPIPAWPRPYFAIRDSRGAEVRTAERVLPLDGGSNFRDLGGYATAAGATTRWGQLYRSAVMSGLTPDDFQRLGKLGIETVCDFRSTDERARDQVNWPAGVQPTVIATDYGLDIGAISAMFREGPVTAERTRTAMQGFYAEMPYLFAGQYARMLRQLVDGRAPLAFNCSAGKDRTGLAAAILLTLLDVPQETVMQDYLLSNEAYRPKLPTAGVDDPTARMFASLPKDALQALMGVDRSYLESSFRAIEAKGGFDRYVAEQLKLSPADVAALKARYVAQPGRG